MLLMKRYFDAVISVLFVLIATGCAERSSSIERLSIDYPNGETRLLVQRDGQAFLLYGALPQRRPVKEGTFDIDDLYASLQQRLHNAVPREQWPNPRSTFGTVHITLSDGKKKDCLIFDEEVFATQLFDKARKGLIDATLQAF